MRKYILLLLVFVAPMIMSADCMSLMKKYDAPDPASKTMAQINRWLKKLDNSADMKVLEKCMIAQAADNPNKAQFAGK